MLYDIAIGILGSLLASALIALGAVLYKYIPARWRLKKADELAEAVMDQPLCMGSSTQSKNYESLLAHQRRIQKIAGEYLSLSGEWDEQSN